jgi:peptidoglycan/xylan/chitin deacetylase (PgdA/CDA1 family)
LRTVLMRSKNSFSWVKQGSIIVMHTNRQSTVEALPKIIASLKKGI